MLPMPKYKNHMHVDLGCSRGRHGYVERNQPSCFDYSTRMPILNVPNKNIQVW